MEFHGVARVLKKGEKVKSTGSRKTSLVEVKSDEKPEAKSGWVKLDVK